MSVDVQQFVVAGVGAEAVENGDPAFVGVDLSFDFEEPVGFFFFDFLRYCVFGAVAAEDDVGVGVGEEFFDPCDASSVGTHSGGREDDCGAVGFAPVFRVFEIVGEVEFVPSRNVVPFVRNCDSSSVSSGVAVYMDIAVSAMVCGLSRETPIGTQAAVGCISSGSPVHTI